MTDTKLTHPWHQGLSVPLLRAIAATGYRHGTFVTWCPGCARDELERRGVAR